MVSPLEVQLNYYCYLHLFFNCSLPMFTYTMAQSLNNIILLFDNWSQPWTFKTFIINNTALNDDAKQLFELILATASDSNNWKDVDLILGCKITQNRLTKSFPLSEDAVAAIVRAASYEWR